MPTGNPQPDAFTSTDDLRSGSPLQYAQTVRFEEPFTLAHGGTLPALSVCYETWGTLNAEGSNAVLIGHAISGDSHAAQHHKGDDPGWWDELIGPSKPIDTDRYFVLCSNVLGGCRGTTGPGTINPDTGKPFGPDFPTVTLDDIVDVQRKLLDHLGIDTLHAVVGGSLGGHQALTWATRYPHRVRNCVAVATSPRLTSQALAFDVVARNAIQRDPHYHGGQYYDQPTRPDVGLAIARMLGHITYLSSEAMDAKFDPDRHAPRDITTAFEKRFSVGSYLAHQGQKFTERFDANSYITISIAIDLFDLGRTREQLMQRLSPGSCDWLVVSFSSDWLFTPRQSREIVNALCSLGKPVTYTEITTDAGHDAFLLPREISLYGPLIAAKLGQPDRSAPPLKPNDLRILDLIHIHADAERSEASGTSSVLDLGCGSGRLLAELKRRGHTQLCGVEVAQEKLIAAAARGLNVIDYDLNQGLPAFTDGQFDVVVLNVTLQAIENTVALLDEMARVGKRVILSFANFAFRDLRDQYARTGRLPRSRCAEGEYDHHWYDTPNRRFPSILDVEELCAKQRLRIHERIYLDTQQGIEVPADRDPNYNADTAILVVSR
jgi:homoserine O-acetyltransferase